MGEFLLLREDRIALASVPRLQGLKPASFKMVNRDPKAPHLAFAMKPSEILQDFFFVLGRKWC
jgi:hypothetical protein